MGNSLENWSEGGRWMSYLTRENFYEEKAEQQIKQNKSLKKADQFLMKWKNPI